jgi:hypothetical protein
VPWKQSSFGLHAPATHPITPPAGRSTLAFDRLRQQRDQLKILDRIKKVVLAGAMIPKPMSNQRYVVVAGASAEEKNLSCFVSQRRPICRQNRASVTSREFPASGWTAMREDAQTTACRIAFRRLGSVDAPPVSVAF